MKSIKPEELEKNVFHMIGKEWLLVTAEKEGKVNTMTAVSYTPLRGEAS